MPAISSSAPGKAILVGEHAVVYGQPAIAVPVEQVRARAIARAAPGRAAGTIRIAAPAIGLDSLLDDLLPDHPLAAAVHAVLRELEIGHPLAFDLRVTSTIPLAAGLGSGAAVSVAVIRAVAEFLGRRLADEQVSRLAFEVEKLHHGTPSGIDNTVIAYARPVYFERGSPVNRVETIPVACSFSLAIGDTGVPSPTSISVGDVRRGWQARPEHFERLFRAIGELVRRARQSIEGGDLEDLGECMDLDHALLVEMGVSSPELDRLVAAARLAGVLGAKLSGGGRGGNMIALAGEGKAGLIGQALLDAGASRVIITTVRASTASFATGERMKEEENEDADSGG